MSGSAGGIRAGKAYVEIYGDKAPLAKTLDKDVPGLLSAFKNEVESIGKAISKSSASWFGGFTITAGDVMGALSSVAGFAGDVIGLGGDLQDMSDRTGLSIEAIGELGHAAGLTGSSMADVEAGARKMQDTLTQAAGGSETAQAALRKLGVTSQELAGLSTDQQMMKLADGIAAIKDPAQRTAAVMDVFGKSGTKLLPMLQGGSAGMEEFREQARKMGRLTAEQAGALDNLGDSFDLLKSTGFNAFASVVASLTPPLQKLFDIMQAGASSVSEFFAKYQPAIQAIGEGAASVLNAVTSWDAWAETLKGFDIILEDTLGVIWTTYRDFAAETIGLFTQVSQGVSDALAAGDLQSAFKVMTAGIYVDWLNLTGDLQSVWIDFDVWLQKTWATVAITFESAWEGAFASVESTGMQTFLFLAKQATELAAMTGQITADQAKMTRMAIGITEGVVASRDERRRMAAINGQDEKLGSRFAEIDKQAAADKAALDAQRKAAQDALDSATVAASAAKTAYDQQQAEKAKQGEAAVSVAAAASGSGAFSVGQLAFGGAGLSQGMFGGAFDKLASSAADTAKYTKRLVEIGEEGNVGA